MTFLSLLGAVVVGVSSWTPVNVSQFWVEPDAPAAFAFDAVSSETSEKTDASETSSVAAPEDFVVRTTDGDVFATGKGVRDGDKMRVETTLPQGFFELEFPATGQAFGVASQPAFCSNVEAADGEDGAPVRDPFFGIDAAATWLVSSDAAREDLIRNAKRIGIATLRERTNWPRIEPNRGEFDFNGDRRGDALRQTALKYKTPILELFHNAPKWAGRSGEQYPNDLNALATSWATVAERWAPSWGALEVWNEPDIFFGGNVPGDQYVPILQTVAREYARRGFETPIVGGVIANFNDAFMNCAAENGILDACDVFSFHTYCRAPEMAAICLRYQRWLDANGASGKPTWITECGRPWKKGTDRPNREADLESAIDIAQKGVVAKAIGFDAYYPFVYPFYEENDNNFGMSDRSNAPLRSIAGYAQTIRVLSDKTAVGELALGASVQAAFVFADKNDATKERVAVLYSSVREKGRTLKLDFAPLYVERITGEKLTPNADGTVDFSDGFLFVGIADETELALKNDSKIAAARNRRAADRAENGVEPRRAPSVVVRFDIDETKVEASSGGYRIVDANAEKFDGTLTVFNFDDEARTLAVSCVATTEGGAPQTDLVEIPATVDVPARGKATVAFSIDAAKISDASPTAPLKTRFEFRDAAGEEVGRLVFQTTRKITRESFDKFATRRVAADLSRAERWRPNCAGCGKLTFKSADALTDGFDWGFDVSFGEGDRWVYPRFSLNVAPDSSRLISESNDAQTAESLDLAECVGVAFRVRATSDDPKSTLRLFVFDENGREYYFTGDGFGTADGEERFVAIPFATMNAYGGTAEPLNPARIRAISIGTNTKGENLSLEAGDFFFFK